VRELEHSAQQASYRRGAIMGLTAAEAFMLICFILLMLLMLWHTVADEDLEFSSKFTEEEKAFVLTNRDVLVRVASVFQYPDVMHQLLETPGLTPDKVINAMKLQERFGTLDPGLIEDRLRLVANEDIRRAVKTMQKVEPEELLKLVDMVDAGKIREVLAVSELNVAPDDLERLRAQNENMIKRLAAYDETGLQPNDIAALSDLMSEVEAARRRLDATGSDIAQKLRDKVGVEIERLGGRILDSGDMIFPDRLLFSSGSAEIEPAFEAVLREVCRSWFEILYGEQESLEKAEIEGHASSEFGGLSARPAFDANLDLSQRRAAAVFRKCLDYGGSDEIAAWARTATAAVGYSSSRPVVDAAGQEDRSASRRVVFSIDMRSVEEVIAGALSDGE